MERLQKFNSLIIVNFCSLNSTMIYILVLTIYSINFGFIQNIIPPNYFPPKRKIHALVNFSLAVCKALSA